MEIMASLPSVVLGFLAALWLAPLLENRVPSLLLMVTVIPTVALLFGHAGRPCRFNIAPGSGPASSFSFSRPSFRRGLGLLGTGAGV
jgi:hypothetical protein